MVDADKTGQWSVPIGAQEPNAIIRIDEIDRLGAHIEDAKDASLHAELPFPIEERLIAVDGEGLSEVGSEYASEIEPLSELPVGSSEVGPARISVNRGEQRSVREPFCAGCGNRYLNRVCI